jgi:hypothetical protein
LSKVEATANLIVKELQFTLIQQRVTAFPAGTRKEPIIAPAKPFNCSFHLNRDLLLPGKSVAATSFVAVVLLTCSQAQKTQKDPIDELHESMQNENTKCKHETVTD